MQLKGSKPLVYFYLPIRDLLLQLISHVLQCMLILVQQLRILSLCNSRHAG